ncbi:MAG: ATP-dependent DNA ligase [Nitrososphaerales archaeon]|nr:ATP-dependent DNA ligase [Nitrososphaerales archaeon]
MDYSIITEVCEALSQTTKRLELTNILVDLFKRTPKELVDKVIYLIQGKIYPDYVGIEIGVADKLAIKALSMVSGMNQDKIIEIFQKLGDIGLVAENILKNKVQTTLFSTPLTVEDVYATFERMAKSVGEGSIEIKLRNLSRLLNDATPLEAKYIMKMVTGRLRLGIADYTVLDALAIAYTGDKANRPILERAYNLSSDLGLVAKTAALKGLEGLKEFKVQIGRPIRPMLAERLESAEEILKKLEGKAAAEYKLDGERLQIHKQGDRVILFSRRLENITNHYPDAIQLVNENVKVNEGILEAEVVAINVDTGEYLPFQELMHRRRKYGIEEAMKQYPIALNFFDLLYVDGEEYITKPYVERRKRLEEVIVETDRVKIVPTIIATKPDEIERFMEQAITDGCEGLVIKDLDSLYRAGAREFAWIKLKREYRAGLTDTIDLVIVGAFYGKGRRAGKYGTFLLAAYDKEVDVFRTACKIGTGFTDEDLEYFPKLLEPYKIPHKHPRVDSRIDADVWFVPKIVIETIAAEITLSPIHTCGIDRIRKGSGLALRFPKYTGRLRDDKSPEDATTVDEIVELYRKQLKKIEEEPLE